LRILLTNDDGIEAEGLECLERIARMLSDDVWVCAPQTEQSGKGRGITLTEPLRVNRLGEKRFAVTGTPTDCVVLAVNDLMSDKPDLVLSGVNRGHNVGEDCSYSGTVAGALQGMAFGIRSIALSQIYSREGMGDSVPFEAAAAWGERVLRPLIDAPLAPRTLVNVNFPAGPADAVKGVRVVGQGLRDYGRLQIVSNTDPRGYEYHWFALGRTVETPAHATDLEATAEGYVSVTPLHLDLTHFESMDMLERAYR